VERVFVAAGSIAGFLGVAFGAFGAHALKTQLTPDALATFEIGMRYQMYHALALIAAAWVCTKWPGAWARASGWLFIAGIVVFSGSLYVLALTGARWLGAVTPIGGLAFLAGWGCLATAAVRGTKSAGW
jgi:uncharacterized membrane protein YgdD (TMEM256/DUF423 family)